MKCYNHRLKMSHKDRSNVYIFFKDAFTTLNYQNIQCRVFEFCEHLFLNAFIRPKTCNYVIKSKKWNLIHLV